MTLDIIFKKWRISGVYDVRYILFLLKLKVYAF